MKSIVVGEGETKKLSFECCTIEHTPSDTTCQCNIYVIYSQYCVKVWQMSLIRTHDKKANPSHNRSTSQNRLYLLVDKEKKKQFLFYVIHLNVQWGLMKPELTKKNFVRSVFKCNTSMVLLIMRERFAECEYNLRNNWGKLEDFKLSLWSEYRSWSSAWRNCLWCWSSCRLQRMASYPPSGWNESGCVMLKLLRLQSKASG